jgi:hypothetical protein
VSFREAVETGDENVRLNRVLWLLSEFSREIPPLDTAENVLELGPADCASRADDGETEQALM